MQQRHPFSRRSTSSLLSSATSDPSASLRAFSIAIMLSFPHISIISFIAARRWMLANASPEPGGPEAILRSPSREWSWVRSDKQIASRSRKARSFRTSPNGSTLFRLSMTSSCSQRRWVIPGLVYGLALSQDRGRGFTSIRIADVISMGALYGQGTLSSRQQRTDVCSSYWQRLQSCFHEAPDSGVAGRPSPVCLSEHLMALAQTIPWRRRYPVLCHHLAPLLRRCECAERRMETSWCVVEAKSCSFISIVKMSSLQICGSADKHAGVPHICDLRIEMV